MINYKKKIQEFHKKFFNKTGDWRGDINQVFLKGNPSAIRLAELIKEEATELVEALRTGTEHDIRKETCDLLYVTFAVPAIYDLPIEEDFIKVHENNMLKFETGSLRADGKWVKHKDHPKVELKQLELKFEV